MAKNRFDSGEAGIRTPEGLTPLTDFESYNRAFQDIRRLTRIVASPLFTGFRASLVFAAYPPLSVRTVPPVYHGARDVPRAGWRAALFRVIFGEELASNPFMWRISHFKGLSRPRGRLFSRWG